MERSACFGGEDLLDFNVKEEGFDQGRWVPLLIEEEGEVFDIGGSDGAVAIVEISEDISY